MEMKRGISGIVLLAVLLPVLLAASGHRHMHVSLPDHGGECSDCLHHIPHAGHLSNGNPGMEDCVLCHFISLPFILSGQVQRLSPADRHEYIPAFISEPFLCGTFHINSSRAPPAA